jgi:FtsZ-binding cell division protein ZapB
MTARGTIRLVTGEPIIPNIEKEDEQSRTSRTSSIRSSIASSGSIQDEQEVVVVKIADADVKTIEKVLASPKEDDHSGTVKMPSLTATHPSCMTQRDEKAMPVTTSCTSYSTSMESSTLVGEQICCGTAGSLSKSSAKEGQQPLEPKENKHQRTIDSNTYTISAVSSSSISTLSCGAFNPPEFEDLLRRKRLLSKNKTHNNEEPTTRTGTLIGVPNRDDYDDDDKATLKKRNQRRHQRSAASPRRRRRSRSSSRRGTRGRSLLPSSREKDTNLPVDTHNHQRARSLNVLRSSSKEQSTEKKTDSRGPSNPHRPPRLPPTTSRPRDDDEGEDKELEKTFQDATKTIARLNLEVEESLQKQIQLRNDLQRCQTTVSDLLRCRTEETSAVVTKEPNICHDLRDELVSAFQLIHEQIQYIKMLESTKGQKGGDCNDTVSRLRCQISKLEVNRAYDEFQLRKQISHESKAFQKTIDHWKRSSESWKLRFEALWNERAAGQDSDNFPPAPTVVVPVVGETTTPKPAGAKRYPVYQHPWVVNNTTRVKPSIWNDQRIPKGKRVLAAGLALTLRK